MNESGVCYLRSVDIWVRNMVTKHNNKKKKTLFVIVKIICVMVRFKIYEIKSTFRSL